MLWVVELAAAAQSALEKTYPIDSVQYGQLSSFSSIKYAIPMYMGTPTPPNEVQEALTRVKAESSVLLRQALADLREDLEENDTVALHIPPADRVQNARTAFIVHGHDEGSREAVARFLERIGIVPVILHEQPNKGRTLIEKFEHHRDVGFAVILLTPDDVGGTGPDTLRPRARQNVILELGYFIAALGRHRVCALKKGDVEQPSDIVGIAYIDYDTNGAWRQQLATEFQAAGFVIDWNKVMILTASRGKQ